MIKVGNRYRLKSEEYLIKEYGFCVPDPSLPVSGSYNVALKENRDLIRKLAGKIMTVEQPGMGGMFLCKQKEYPNEIFHVPEDAMLSGVE